MSAFGSVPRNTDPPIVTTKHVAIRLVFALAFCAWHCGATAATLAESPRPSPFEASTSDASRHEAMRAMPLEKLEPEQRAKVESVFDNVSIFRRLPAKVVQCDPDLYLFLVRHPDVVVNIWDVLKLSKLQLRQAGENQFQIAETTGTTANLEILYSSHDTQLIYGEGTYRGPLFAQAIKGRGVLLLKSGYVRETDGRYYVTCRLDSFLAIEPGAVELITKTVQPLVGKTADNNFFQTMSFVGSLSRTIESNNRGVQRLASQLEHVQPEVRNRFAALAGEVAAKSAPSAHAKSAQNEVASRREETTER